MSLSADHQRSKTLGDVLAVKDLEKKEGQYSRPLQWLNINLLVISLFHVATIWALFSGTFNQTMLVLTLVAIWVRMFALNGGYHRYFSHRYVIFAAAAFCGPTYAPTRVPVCFDRFC